MYISFLANLNILFLFTPFIINKMIICKLRNPVEYLANLHISKFSELFTLYLIILLVKIIFFPSSFGFITKIPFAPLYLI